MWEAISPLGSGVSSVFTELLLAPYPQPHSLAQTAFLLSDCLGALWSSPGLFRPNSWKFGHSIAWPCPLKAGLPQAMVQPVPECGLKPFQALASFILLDFEMSIYHHN